MYTHSFPPQTLSQQQNRLSVQSACFETILSASHFWVGVLCDNICWVFVFWKKSLCCLENYSFPKLLFYYMAIKILKVKTNQKTGSQCPISSQYKMFCWDLFTVLFSFCFLSVSVRHTAALVICNAAVAAPLLSGLKQGLTRTTWWSDFVLLRDAQGAVSHQHLISEQDPGVGSSVASRLPNFTTHQSLCWQLTGFPNTPFHF